MNDDKKGTAAHAPTANDSVARTRWRWGKKQLAEFELEAALSRADRWIQIAADEAHRLAHAEVKRQSEVHMDYPELTLHEHACDSDPIDESPPPPPEVPLVGERLVSILSGEMREAVLGDLAERFEERAAQRGLRRARAWYWWQVTRTTARFAVRWVRRLTELDALLQRIGF